MWVREHRKTERCQSFQKYLNMNENHDKWSKLKCFNDHLNKLPRFIYYLDKNWNNVPLQKNNNFCKHLVLW